MFSSTDFKKTLHLSNVYIFVFLKKFTVTGFLFVLKSMWKWAACSVESHILDVLTHFTSPI